MVYIRTKRGSRQPEVGSSASNERPPALTGEYQARP
jgi:hypothetical protein